MEYSEGKRFQKKVRIYEKAVGNSHEYCSLVGDVLFKDDPDRCLFDLMRYIRKTEHAGSKYWPLLEKVSRDMVASVPACDILEYVVDTYRESEELREKAARQEETAPNPTKGMYPNVSDCDEMFMLLIRNACNVDTKKEYIQCQSVLIEYCIGVMGKDRFYEHFQKPDMTSCPGIALLRIIHAYKHRNE